MNSKQKEAVHAAVDEIVTNACRSAREFGDAMHQHVGPAYEDWYTRNARKHSEIELAQLSDYILIDLHNLGFEW